MDLKALTEQNMESQEEVKKKDFEETNDFITVETKEQFGGDFNEEDYIDAPPDGGLHAWVCCACVTVMNMMTWGVNSSFSVFLAFYLDNNKFPGATPTDYGIIAGMVGALTLIMIPYSAVLLMRFGYKTTVTAGIFLGLAGYIGASFAKTIAQLYITQGLMMGVSYGLIFGANSIVLPSWFLRKRALANGFSHFGLGLGGALFSLLVNALIHKTGDQKWALRVLGIITTACSLVAMLLVKIRVPKNAKLHGEKSAKEIIKSIFDYHVWKSLPLQLATIWSCLCGLGYTICLLSLSNYAVSLGYSHTQATNVAVTFSMAQSVGRPMMGYASDKLGKVNFTLFGTIYSAVLTFAVWTQITSFASLIVFTFFLGLLIGIGSVNVVPMVADVVGLQSYPSAFGWANTFTGISILISEVIGLNLRDYNLKNPYKYCQYFVGAIYIAGTLVLIPYRSWKVDRMLYQMKGSKTLSEEEAKKYEELAADRTIGGYIRRAFFIGRKI